MDLSHGSISALAGAEAEMSSRSPSPGRDPEPVCRDSSTLGAPFTWRINSEYRHEGKSQVLKAQEERVHVSHTTSHALQVHGSQGQVAVRVLCPLGCGRHSSTCNRNRVCSTQYPRCADQRPGFHTSGSAEKSSSYGQNNF